jgi:SAM-dependent MidA family methyltransferase
MTRSEPGLSLPSLSAAERRQSKALQRHIHRELQAAGGWLSFERFMQLALYAPGLGYYSAGSVKLGPAGDFVTAPEISDLFSACVARQCAQILNVSGGDILEFGAGTGRMACTILHCLHEAHGVLPERYNILEVSADLNARQQERVAQLPPELRKRVTWLTELPRHPLRGVVLANEVLDALPCSRFAVVADTAYELGVVSEGERFAWRAGRSEFAPAAELLEQLLELHTALPDGYVSEFCRNVTPWMGAAAAALEQGALLLFDYGLPRAQYYHPQRVMGTLMCHFRQRAHADPFINVGLQDITAWVDFTRVAEAAVAAELDVAGFATQAAFLLGTGITELSAPTIDAVAQARQASEMRRLLLPGEMGEAFKVMALTRGLEQPLQGFAHQDLRPSL